MVYIIIIETNFEAGNSIKTLFIKKTIDQIRFPIKKYWFESLQNYFFPQLSEAATGGVLYKKGVLRKFLRFAGKHLY